MTYRNCTLPKPTLPQEFEAICLALYRKIWCDPNAQLNGVNGQRQNGVDIFGHDVTSGKAYGVQCKVRSKRITFPEIESEIEKAEGFLPRIQHFIIATTADRDGSMQTKIRQLSERRCAAGLFAVHIVSWNELTDMLDEHRSVATRFFSFLDDQPPFTEAVGSAIGNEDLYAHRLAYALKLLNENRAIYNMLTVSRVAEALQSERISDVAKYFEGKEEPTIRFMHDFAAEFGVNADWLIHGEDEAFYCGDPMAFTPVDAISFIERNGHEDIFIIRSDSVYGECAIVVRLKSWRYVTINGTWNVSSHVGGTGRSQMEDLCLFFVHMLKNRIAFRGCSLDNETFYKLKEGQIYPGSVLEGRNRESDWCVALLDFEHRKNNAQKYGEWHGQSLLDAQSILKDYLSFEAKKLIQAVW
ncbi:hypothetical protein GJ700_17765 [Duganella sp. FT92W]|uniref:Restriction endonuclease type IV Mrr domain-containing protein n=1 Tax=Pseudoduganella rivuli TaxID=2666085 RepID=A0A7X2LU42_9BURK|nr:restriction endonuclease [Pseudoduganella rivuli]MRV73563.1 hypothetical protein [Pseudoduganella rivuli]